jgi:hypothetical protein
VAPEKPGTKDGDLVFSRGLGGMTIIIGRFGGFSFLPEEGFLNA